MLKTINSYSAHRNWIKTHGLMAGEFQSLALVAIQKAVELEPNLKLIPKYLELQAQIESSVGKWDQALQTFQRATGILRNNPNLFDTQDSKAIEKRILEAIEEINSKAKT